MALPLIPQLLVRDMLVRIQPVFEGEANNILARHTQQLGQARIAVDDLPFRIEHRGRLRHSLHEQTVGKVCTLQCVNAMTVHFLDHEGIYGPMSNGVHGLLGFLGPIRNVRASMCFLHCLSLAV